MLINFRICKCKVIKRRKWILLWWPWIPRRTLGKEHAHTPKCTGQALHWLHAHSRRGSHNSVDFTQPSAADSRCLQPRTRPGWHSPGWQHRPARPRPGWHRPGSQTPTTLRRTRKLCATLDISAPHLTTLRHSPRPCRQTGHSHRVPPPCRTLRREPRTHARTHTSTRALLVSISHTAATLCHTTATLRHIAATLRHTAATLHHTSATLRHSPYPTSQPLRYVTEATTDTLQLVRHSRYARAGTSQQLRHSRNAQLPLRAYQENESIK